MKRMPIYAIFAFVPALLAAACAPAAPPSPTAAPPKPVATTQPAQPAATAAPAAKTTSPDAAAKPAASPAEITVPKPSGNLSFKVAYSSAFGFSHLPELLTADRLARDGWKIEHANFAQTELAVEAAAKGEIQVQGGATSTAMLAAQKGGKIAPLIDRNANEWVLAGRTDIRRCDDLAGKRLAIHSEGSVSTAMTRAWLADACKVTPNYLVISGSENRSAALINGQIDATPLELSDWVNVNLKEPGKFHLITNFAKGLPNLSTSAFSANTDWVKQSRPVVVAWLAELLKTHRMVAADPALLVEGAKKYVPELDAKALPEIIKAYNEIDGFPANGGLTQKKVEGTIEFFTRPDQLQPGLKPEQVTDLSVLEDALKIIGRVPGKP